MRALRLQNVESERGAEADVTPKHEAADASQPPPPSAGEPRRVVYS
jgi:hypothetical protein